MKKKIDLKGLQVKSFKTDVDVVKGGCRPVNTSPIASLDFEFCDYTCNAFCTSRGNTNCNLCTVPL